MLSQIIGAAVVPALVAILLGWLVARRYGQRRGLIVPLLALLASVLSVCRSTGLDPSDAMARAGFALALAGPSVLGALVGVALARPKAG